MSAGFEYDGDGSRVKGVVNGVTTLYVNEYYEVESATVLVEALPEAPSVREDGVLSYLLSDPQGSTTLAVNEEGTATTGELRYTSWGETRYSEGTTPTNRRYTGQYKEAELGLYFFNARWVDPQLGRFTSADSIIPEPGDPIAWDRYAYGINNPVKYNDPSGHIACWDEHASDPECKGKKATANGVRPDPYDPDGDDVPNLPDPTMPVTIGTSPGCQHSSYVECFYARERFTINGSMAVDADQFTLLETAVFFDIRNRYRTRYDRMNYDTPFWDGGDTPGKVCFSSDCYERHEVNYFAQGMWAAANGDSLVPSEIAVVGGWKILNWIKDNKTYPSPFPSGGTSNWFEAGYNMYNVLNKNYNDLVHTYQAY